ncbi:MAG: Flp family type IVb pilin [Candidatus Brocadiia bacterium]
MAAYVVQLLRWLSRRRGQGIVEYALILCLVAIVVVAAVTALGESLPGPLNETSNALADAI